jgi:hypothetical protein
MNATGYTRNRWCLSVLIIAVIALGLASRKFAGLFPAALGNYPGDALWAMAAYLMVAFILPSMLVGKLVGLALAISYFVEFSQLISMPWLDAIRGTRVGHLLLGQNFDWRDLVALTIGVGVAAFVDTNCAWIARQKYQ